MAKPILKWAGGKRQLLAEIYRRFPEAYTHYHEPFFGGGAVFFDLEPADGTVNDTNRRLVNFYRVVQDRPEELIERLRTFEDPESDPDLDQEFAEENWKGKPVDQYFYQQRARFNRRAYRDEDDWPETDAERLEEAALLLYLNRTCYNGLYRENSDGGFNVPIGRFSNPDWVMVDRIRDAHRALDDTDIFRDDFTYVVEAASEGDLVYFDPPYKPMSSTANFAEYSADGFDQDDQERLLETCETLDEKGVKFVLSNSGVMFDKYDSAGFSVAKEGATRSINSDETARGEVDEIIATNVPEEERQPPKGQASIVDF